MFAKKPRSKGGALAVAQDPSRSERLQIMLSAEELAALDDWRFKWRMPSRASAIRELLRRGLAAEGFVSLPGTRKSTSFGVLESKDQ
jgi:hypothetical protein